MIRKQLKVKQPKKKKEGKKKNQKQTIIIIFMFLFIFHIGFLLFLSSPSFKILSPKLKRKKFYYPPKDNFTKQNHFFAMLK